MGAALIMFYDQCRFSALFAEFTCKSAILPCLKLTNALEVG
jgi:hypothetical protein